MQINDRNRNRNAVVVSTGGHYRHYVSFSVLPTSWTDYPISLTKHGLTRVNEGSFTCQVNQRETAITCVAIEVDDRYTTAPKMGYGFVDLPKVNIGRVFG